MILIDKVLFSLILAATFLFLQACSDPEEANNATPTEQVAQTKTQSAVKESLAETKSGKPPSNEAKVEAKELIKALGDPQLGDLAAIKERGFIRALVTNSRTDFFLDNGRIRGIQAEFLHEFEKVLNENVSNPAHKVRVQFLPVPFNQLIPALEAGYGDIAAAFLTVTPERAKQVDFVADRRLRVEEVLVTHKNTQTPQTLEDLSGQTIHVLHSSSYAEHLRAFNKTIQAKGLAPINIVEADANLLSEDILEFVNAGIFSMTVVDNYRAKLWSQVMPDIKVHNDLAIAPSTKVGWAIRQNSPQLKKALTRFNQKVGKGTLLGNILFNRYFANQKWLQNPNSESALNRFEKYQGLFTKYARQYEFEPLQLVAQGFQESGLQQNKKSHAGAIGIMQLLPSTAADKNVGIKHIDKPEANIHAGAKYLDFIRDRYFDEPDISSQDQMFFSWAAYNAGPAKVKRMRERAQALKLDPNKWFGHVEVAAGQIVGRETVDYVSNIHKLHLAYTMASNATQRKAQAIGQLE